MVQMMAGLGCSVDWSAVASLDVAFVSAVKAEQPPNHDPLDRPSNAFLCAHVTHRTGFHLSTSLCAAVTRASWECMLDSSKLAMPLLLYIKIQAYLASHLKK